jgi:hypothetical protein
MVELHRDDYAYSRELSCLHHHVANKEFAMKTTVKKILLSSLAVTAFTLGAVGTANAGYWVTDAYGNSAYIRTCHNQWTQTGPFAGQGYLTRYCN